MSSELVFSSLIFTYRADARMNRKRITASLCWKTRSFFKFLALIFHGSNGLNFKSLCCQQSQFSHNYERKIFYLLLQMPYKTKFKFQRHLSTTAVRKITSQNKRDQNYGHIKDTRVIRTHCVCASSYNLVKNCLFFFTFTHTKFTEINELVTSGTKNNPQHFYFIFFRFNVYLNMLLLIILIQRET